MSYIIADLYRFFRKKSFLFLLVLFTVGYTFFFNLFKNDPNDVMLLSNILISMSSVLIGIALFVMVYTDDIGAHSTQIAIGYGIPRYQIVLSKLVEMLIIYLIVLAYAFGLASLLNVALNVQADLTQLFDLIPIVILELMINTAIAGIFSFVLQKSSIAIVVFVVLSGRLLDSLLGLVLELKWIANILPNAVAYLPTSLLNDMSTSGIQFNNAGILILYGALALAITIALFNRTELEF